MKNSATILAMLFTLFSSSLYADVFASRIRLTNPDDSPFDGKFGDGTDAKISYILNDTATAVSVQIIDASTNAVVATINGGAQSRGMNAVVWNGNGSTGGKKYYVQISATQNSYSATDYTIFYFQQTGEAIGDPSRGIYTRGVDAVTNMMLPKFGNLYASNADGGSNTGYKTGVLRYTADGSFYGTSPGHPILEASLGTANGGTFNWSGLAPWYATVDRQGEVYISGNGTAGIVYKMKNDTVAPKAFIGGIKDPRGLCVVDTGANRKVYIAADTVVWRVDLGNSDSATAPPVLVASLGLYVRDVIVDDDGHLIVALRTTGSTAPGYIEHYDLSTGTLPKTRADADWSASLATGLPIGFGLVHGANKNSSEDDTLYFSVRGGDNSVIGIWRLTGITGFIEYKQIIRPTADPRSAGGNISTNADMTVDYAGNIILFENGNEEIFMISPPHESATNTEVTRSAMEYVVAPSTSVGEQTKIPKEFVLDQNYPNPFNPSTTIGFHLPVRGKVTVTVYDVLGNLVKELFVGEADPGYTAVVWNATNNAGMKVSSGMYLYRLTAQLSDGRVFTDVKRMMLLK
ncbi:MAG: FlgD immunoglobulin-like domain containing protein [Bacteroidota bacterium]